MDYDDSATALELRDRAREFMEEVVLPKERANAAGSISRETIDELREQAREYDVYAPQIPEEHGGMGIALRDVLPLFEAVRPDDTRPRDAIEAARAWARGELAMMQARAAGGHAMVTTRVDLADEAGADVAAVRSMLVVRGD